MQTVKKKRQVGIILNMEEIRVNPGFLSYEDIARLAYPNDPVDPQIIYTITVTYPNADARSLGRGDKPVVIKKGMAINARKTGRS
jgi:hypothetical protein